MSARSVKAFAPASVSNLGPGFDVLGVAVEKPGDFVLARRKETPGLLFSVQTAQAQVPQDPRKNVAAYVANLMLEELKPSFGIELSLQKSMPIGSGLGSSAASSVAAAMAVNALLKKPLHKPELLRFALEGERFACGSVHADNAAPSLLGGAFKDCIIFFNLFQGIFIPCKCIIIRLTQISGLCQKSLKNLDKSSWLCA